MALTNDFKVKNGLTVVDSITAGGNLSASEGYFIDNLGIGTNQPGYKAHIMVDNSSLALSAANGIRIENDSPGVGTMSVAHFRSNTQDWYIGNRNCSSTSNFFFTHENDEVLTIEGGGKVGIGTTSPENNLHVAGGTLITGRLALGSYSYYPGGTLYSSSGTTVLRAGSGVDVISLQNSDLSDSFASFTTNYICLNRDVGVGTTSPNEKLTVAGSISAQNSVCVGATTNGFVSAGRDLADIFAGGDITSVTAGNYLTGGADTGDVVIGLDSSCAVKWDNSSAGGVTSVGAAAPLSSSGGLTPTICLYESCDTNWSNTYTTVQANSASWAQGTIDGSGTEGKLPIWTGSGSTLTDSILSANSDQVLIEGNVCINSAGTNTLTIDSTNSFGRELTFSSNGILPTISANSCLLIETSNNDTRILLDGGGSTDNIQFITNEIERARITTTGLGIGTTSPSKTLHVAGDSLVTGDSTIYGNLSVTGDFTCLETTVSTTSALSVTNTGTGPALYVCQAGIQPIAHFVDANGDDIVFADDGKIGVGTYSPSARLHLSGASGADSSIRQSRGGAAIWDQQIDSSGRLTWSHYATEGGSANPLFTLDDSDRVGIGTTTPTTVFEINDDAAAGSGLRVTGGGQGCNLASFVRDIGTTGPEINIHASNADPSTTFVHTAKAYTIGLDQSADAFVIANATDLSNTDDYNLVIDSAGNVGIGTTSPNEKLTVAGSISAQDSVCVGATSNGFVSAGRDLADIFATSTGNVDGSGTACTLAVWEDSDTIGDSILYADNSTVCVGGALSAHRFCSNDSSNNIKIGGGALASLTSGADNIGMGCNALQYNTTGSCNIAMTKYALICNTGGSNNFAAGYAAMFNNTDGSKNTAIGSSALRFNTSGGNNIAIGDEVLYCSTTGDRNVALGQYTMNRNTTGYDNFASGYAALYCNSTGTRNTSIGYQAMYLSLSSSHNFAAGQCALYSNWGGNNNVAIGQNALKTNTTGPSNTAIGWLGLYSNTTGGYNTAIGQNSLQNNTTGYHNTAIGYRALTSNTTGGCNTALGPNALDSNISGVHNTAIGLCALFDNTTGSYNTAFGVNALYNSLSGCHNFAAGCSALYSNWGGINNTAIGNSTLNSNTTGNNNTAIGNTALCRNTTGSSNAAIGGFALYSNTTGDSNNAIGFNALFANTTGGYNTAIGDRALCANTTGSYNTALGLYALRSNTTGNYNTAIGITSLYSNTCGTFNIAIGNSGLCSNTSGCNNIALGSTALRCNIDGSFNTAFGNSALNSNTSGNYNTAIGQNALYTSLSGDNNTAIGYQSLYYNYGGYENTAIGRYSLFCNTEGCDNVAVGSYSLCANTTGCKNIAIGRSALLKNATGINNTVLGANAMSCNLSGDYNFAAGCQAAYYNTGGCYNTAIGYNSLHFNDTGCYNAAIGCYALFCNTTGDYNNAIGGGALYYNTTGGCNFASGRAALYNNTEGHHNIAIGEVALCCNTTNSNNIAFGLETLR